jgi:hypothetical protein
MGKESSKISESDRRQSVKNSRLSKQDKRSVVPTRTYWIRYEDADGKPIEEDGFLTREQAVRRLRDVGEQIDDQIRQKQVEAEESERA